MDAQTFLDNFATVADAPGGVQRLRELVLDLAVSGRLIAQDFSDEPAEQLLTSISKARLVAESNLTEPVSVDDQPWNVPDSWRWARLKEVSDFAAGRTPPTKDATYWSPGGGHAWVSIGDMPEGGEVTTTRRRVTNKAVAKIFRQDPDPPGTILMSFKLTIGKVARLAVPAFHNEAIVSISTPFDVMGEYLFRTLPLLTKGGLSKAAIMGDTLNKTSLTNLLIPVPPLAEQNRIVEKADELITLCDELETRQERRHRTTTRFRGSALHALTEADTPDELRLSWERVNTNWPTVTDDGNSIPDLRDVVVELAVDGQLEPQEPTDASAAQLLEECQHRKADLVAAGARSRSGLPPVSPTEAPFDLPAGWALARLDEWCDIAGGLAKGRKLAGRATSVVPYLRVANVKAGYLLLDEVKEIEVAADEVDRYMLRTGDVLLTEGGDWDKLGRSAIWLGSIDPCLHQNHIFRARTLAPGLQPEWISLFTNSAAGRGYFQSKAKRTTNLASINMTELRSIPLPVPPPAEQKRILARVAKLTDAIDRLGRSLDAQAGAQRLLASGVTSST